MNDINTNELKTLLDEYADNEKLYKLFQKADKNRKKIREKIAEYMHKTGINEIIESDNLDNEWKCAYVTNERKNVDHGILLREIGIDKYNEVVTINETSYLKISPAPKKKKNSLSNKAPKKEKVDQVNVVPVATGIC